MNKALQASVATHEPADNQLLAQMTMRDSRALELLYDRYATIVYATALRMLGSVELAEEIVQEAFWRVWQRCGTFNAERGHVASWLFGIAHNLCIDELRRQRVRPSVSRGVAVELEMLDMPDPDADVAGMAMQRERQRLVGMALQQIPAEQREVLELAYFGGLSQSEIATQLQIPLGTIKTRIRSGLQRLRDLLQSGRLTVDDLVF
ncbi:MAG TPA: sigma-70 family RNA polymerase sigma factor [Roseiflexaceae bacterium]|nr:sigma-70 family RNA polymerase sigma factor [Roseiflexaceae bacterium]HMP41299.1 sigma-70 family RNA polymerase sigma factor [Roseiflexaceae bacterium]